MCQFQMARPAEAVRHEAFKFLWLVIGMLIVGFVGYFPGKKNRRIYSYTYVLFYFKC